MKKHLRVLAAVLVLCFSLLCPAASAASVQTAACIIDSKSGRLHCLQKVLLRK